MRWPLESLPTLTKCKTQNIERAARIDGEVRSQHPLKALKCWLSEVEVEKQQHEFGLLFFFFFKHWFHLRGLRGHQTTKGAGRGSHHLPSTLRAVKQQRPCSSPTAPAPNPQEWPNTQCRVRSDPFFHRHLPSGAIRPSPQHPSLLFYNQNTPGFENHFTTQHLKLSSSRFKI